MIVKAKLRCIGNSLGVILPVDVITGCTKGDVIMIDVITDSADVITHRGSGSIPDGTTQMVAVDAIHKSLPIKLESHGCAGCKLMSYEQGSSLSCPVAEHSTASAEIFEEDINPDRDCTQAGV